MMRNINGPAASMHAFPWHVHLSQSGKAEARPENDRSVERWTELCQWQTQLRYWKDRRGDEEGC